MKYKLFIPLGIVVVVIVLVAVVEVLMVKYDGKPVPVPNIPRAPEVYGTVAGQPITYVVMGDSTSVGQGGNYESGIARSTARYLARERRVTMHNVGISGARAADVISKQLKSATELKPDVVLLAICANDVTHQTAVGDVRSSLNTTVDALQAANPAVRIILTGSPPMGSVPRFPQPIRYLAGMRAKQMNTMVAEVASYKKLTFAPIAAETGKTFAEHPELFAVDKFHPNTNGYQIWMPTLQRAIDALW